MKSRLVPWQLCLLLFQGESWDEQLALTSSQARLSYEKTGNKRVDWDWVQHSVVASEPPRLQDVPAHMAFCKAWGGGESQPYMKKTFDYLNAVMPAGRIVSGSFLQKLASLKFPPRELAPIVVHACVMTQAVLSAEREQIGVSVTDNHVRSLVKEKKDMVMQAETTLKKQWP